MARKPSPIWTSLLFSCFAATVPAGAGTLETIFNNGFESGALGGWSEAVGSVCPFLPPVPATEGGFLEGDVGDRYITYEGRTDEVGDIVGRFLLVELWESYGGPTAPDLIDLGFGDENNYQTCGSCVLFFVNLDTTDFTWEKVFFQREGSLNITALDPTLGGAFEATLNAVLEEVTIDGNAESTPVPNGCIIDVVNYPISETLADPPI